MVSLCEKMSWTFEEYLDQPEWFIKLLLEKMFADARHENRQARKMKLSHGKRSK